MTALHAAAENNAPAELTRLFLAGVDINATVDRGKTALVLALQERHAGCARLLRVAGARK